MLKKPFNIEWSFWLLWLAAVVMILAAAHSCSELIDTLEKVQGEPYGHQRRNP